MEQECELLERCGLYKKYQPTDGLACEWFIGQYCSGLAMTKCRRKRFYLKYGMLPSDDLLPNGAVIADKTERQQLFVRS